MIPVQLQFLSHYYIFLSSAEKKINKEWIWWSYLSLCNLYVRVCRKSSPWVWRCWGCFRCFWAWSISVQQGGTVAVKQEETFSNSVSWWSVCKVEEVRGDPTILLLTKMKYKIKIEIPITVWRNSLGLWKWYRWLFLLLLSRHTFIINKHPALC